MITHKIKYKYYKSLTIILLAILFISPIACTKKFDEMNIPPTSLIASKIDVNLLGQAFAQVQYFGLFGGANYQQANNLYADLYAQYFSTTHPNFNSDQFQEISAWSNTNWSRFYANAIQQRLVEKFTEENNMPIHNALAKVWRAEIYHRMVDYWGSIIYSEFDNGESVVHYDDAKTVYMDLFKKLDEAVAVLKQNAGKNAFGAHDQIYAGNVDKWAKFANSLRLRLAMRVVYVDPALAKSEAEKAITPGVITANADNASIISTINSVNFVSRWTYINEFRMSATVQSVLSGYSDPRLPEYFALAVNSGTFKGLRNGLAAQQKSSALNNEYSFVAKKYMPIDAGGSNPPNPVLHAAEVYFLRAEGALRGWNMGGTAPELYNTGIRMSITDRTTASAATIDAYIISTKTPAAVNDPWNTPAMSNIPVLYDAAGSFERRLEQIITQKWISIYPDGWESWSERRRTGYPKGYPILNSLNP